MLRAVCQVRIFRTRYGRGAGPVRACVRSPDEKNGLPSLASRVSCSASGSAINEPVPEIIKRVLQMDLPQIVRFLHFLFDFLNLCFDFLPCHVSASLLSNNISRSILLLLPSLCNIKSYLFRLYFLPVLQELRKVFPRML